MLVFNLLNICFYSKISLYNISFNINYIKLYKTIFNQYFKTFYIENFNNA